MKKTVIIVDHPSFDRSVVNRRWLEEVRKYPDEFIVHNLQSSYPRRIIDTAQEHSLIDSNGSVVFQFPLYWYNCPPLTKQWFDSCLTPDWAYGKEHKLKGRKIAFAVTCGSEESAYCSEGRHHVALSEYLNSFTHSVEFVQAENAGIFAFFGANTEHATDAEKLAESARNYVEFLRTLKV